MSDGLADTDLPELFHENLAPLRPRLVIPVEERDVGNLPAEGLEKTRFELGRTVDDVLAS